MDRNNCSQFYIHDEVAVRITGSLKKMAYLCNAYEKFRTYNGNAFDIDVQVGKFDRPHLGNFAKILLQDFMVAPFFYAKKNEFYYKGSHKGVIWEVHATGVEETRTVLRYNGWPLSSPFFFYQFLEPLIRIKLTLKGFVSLHSSSVSKNGEATLFNATGGTGKTATMMALMNDGYASISDDYTILSKDAKVYFYPTPCSMDYYRLKYFPQIKNKLPMPTILNVLLRSLVFTLSNKFVSLPARLHIEDILPNARICKESVLRNLVLLKKYTGSKAVVSPNGIEEAINDIIAIGQYESKVFDRYLAAYLSVVPDSRLKGHWQRFSNILGVLLKSNNIPCMSILVPKTNFDNYVTMLKSQKLF